MKFLATLFSIYNKWLDKINDNPVWLTPTFKAYDVYYINDWYKCLSCQEYYKNNPDRIEDFVSRIRISLLLDKET